MLSQIQSDPYGAGFLALQNPAVPEPHLLRKKSFRLADENLTHERN